MPRLAVALAALACLLSCSEDRGRPSGGGGSTPSCRLPVCPAAAQCACDTTTACDPGCEDCDPECGDCRPASLNCSMTGSDAGPSGGDAGPRPDGSTGRDGSVVRNDVGPGQPECASSTDCGGRLCDRARGVCADCRTTLDCPTGRRCSAGACVATPACQSDLTCTPMGMVCDQTAGRCVECKSSAECGDTAACVGRSCFPTVACQSSLQCTATNMVCGAALPPAWPVSFGGMACGECNSIADCAPRETCRDRMCLSVCADRICGTVDGADCGSCSGAAQCLESGRGCMTSFPIPGTQYFADAGDRLFVGNDGRSGGGGIIELTFPQLQPRQLEQAGGSVYIDGLALNSSNVYWAKTNGEIRTRGRAGGAVTTFTRVPGSMSSWCQALAADDSYVFCGLVDYDDMVEDGLYKVPAGGGQPSLVDRVVQPSGLIAQNGEVYWSLFNDGLIGKTDVATGRRTVLVREQGHLLAVIAGTAYYEDTRDEIRRIPAGTTRSEPVAQRKSWAGHTDSHLYLVNRVSPETLERTALDGTMVEPIATVQELNVGDYVRRVFVRPEGLYVAGEWQSVLISP